MGLFKNLAGSLKSANSSVVDVPTKATKKSSSGKPKTAPKMDFPKNPMHHSLSRY
ncbi:hypothetical protein VKS41_008553 [Umbelopsis sp. WA50703]